MNARARSLSPIRRDLLLRIVAAVQRDGYSPTYLQLADALDRTKVTVYQHVRALCQLGLLNRSGRHVARGLSPTPKALALILDWKKSAHACPLCGRTLDPSIPRSLDPSAAPVSNRSAPAEAVR